MTRKKYALVNGERPTCVWDTPEHAGEKNGVHLYHLLGTMDTVTGHHYDLSVIVRIGPWTDTVNQRHFPVVLIDGSLITDDEDTTVIPMTSMEKAATLDEIFERAQAWAEAKADELFSPMDFLTQALDNSRMRHNPISWTWDIPHIQTNTYKVYPIYRIIGTYINEKANCYATISGTVKYGMSDTFVEGTVTRSRMYKDSEGHLYPLDPERTPEFIEMHPIEWGPTQEATLEKAQQYLEEKANELLFTPMELLSFGLSR